MFFVGFPFSKNSRFVLIPAYGLNTPFGSRPPDFLVGYGLDFGERYRHLPFVAKLNEDSIEDSIKEEIEGTHG